MLHARMRINYYDMHEIINNCIFFIRTDELVGKIPFGRHFGVFAVARCAEKFTLSAFKSVYSS